MSTLPTQLLSLLTFLALYPRNQLNLKLHFERHTHTSFDYCKKLSTPSLGGLLVTALKYLFFFFFINPLYSYIFSFYGISGPRNSMWLSNLLKIATKSPSIAFYCLNSKDTLNNTVLLNHKIKEKCVMPLIIVLFSENCPGTEKPLKRVWWESTSWSVLVGAFS